MGFSGKIKEDILVASARHCCVCHRYRGVKVEVHHIKPQEQEGLNTFENAIALCFDCHSDAGHYFTKHPKGTKFSPAELRKHKKVWFHIVQNNEIPIPDEKNIILSKYLITSEFGIIKEILENDLKHFPISNTLLLETPTLTFLRKLFKNQKYRRAEYTSNLVIQEQEYLNHFPNAIKYNENSVFSYYIHSRTPSINEIEDCCKKDKLSIYLTSNGIAPSEICRTVTHVEKCGGGGFEELFIVRPLYISLLTITNISTCSIKLNKADFEFFNGIKYTQKQNDGVIKSIDFPNISVLPNQSVVIPIGVILPDFDDFEKIENSSNETDLSWEQNQVLSHGEIVSNSNQEFIGPSLNPTKFYFNNSCQYFHEFDFNNLYWIDRHWQCGSCPHLFYENSNRELVYQRELFTIEPNLYQIETIEIPKNVNAIIIAELEKEITLVKSIRQNVELVREDVTLHENMDIRFAVKQHDVIELEGMYSFKSSVFRKMITIAKEKLIKEYIKNYTQ